MDRDAQIALALAIWNSGTVRMHESMARKFANIKGWFPWTWHYEGDYPGLVHYTKRVIDDLESNGYTVVKVDKTTNNGVE